MEVVKKMQSPTVFKGYPPPFYSGAGKKCTFFFSRKIWIILDWEVVWRSRLVRWIHMGLVNTFGACCHHLLLKTTFVANWRKNTKKGDFFSQMTWCAWCPHTQFRSGPTPKMKKGDLSLSRDVLYASTRPLDPILWILKNGSRFEFFFSVSERNPQHSSSENVFKTRYQIWPDWYQTLIFHNFCSTEAFLMRLKYVTDHILKFC